MGKGDKLRFCNDNAKEALVIKTSRMGKGVSKNYPNCSTSFYFGERYYKIFNIIIFFVCVGEGVTVVYTVLRTYDFTS